jgi:hypothetical protein
MHSGDNAPALPGITTPECLGVRKEAKSSARPAMENTVVGFANSGLEKCTRPEAADVRINASSYEV